ncbi:S8 family serine peptidase [Staphylococcus hyicus]|uniref:S8 family peptidase n=1 Tax=Staphylococcus hyicus TaxID=1284 RepID=UPI0036D20F68
MNKWIITIFVLMNLVFIFIINYYANRDNTLKVAILDSGVNHKFIGNDIKTINFSSEKDNNDYHNHGTPVSSLITKGIKNVEFYHLKVLDKNGNSDSHNINRALKWCKDNQVQIINMSFGFENINDKTSKLIDDLGADGVIIVASSGNNFGGDSDFPASHPLVISVGGLDKNLNLSKYSSSGKIDIYNISENIKSINNQGKYQRYNGNSFATALVTHEVIKLKLKDKTINSNNLKSKTNNYDNIEIFN